MASRAPLALIYSVYINRPSQIKAMPAAGDNGRFSRPAPALYFTLRISHNQPYRGVLPGKEGCMEHFTAGGDAQGKGLVRVILANYPSLTPGRVFQALRRKDIRINGRRVHSDRPIAAGDEITLYLDVTPRESRADGVHTQPAGQALAAAEQIGFSVIYEDPLVMIVNKQSGISVQPGRAKTSAESSQTVDAAPQPDEDLLSRIRRVCQDPAIELGHRLDRQTGGLLLLTRKPAARDAFRAIQSAGRVIKRYRCLVRGVPASGKPVTCHDGLSMLEMTGWLEKDAEHSEVYIHDDRQAGDRPVVTRYRVLAVYPGAGPDQQDVAQLEVELVTGRTHQVRAHFAHIGHPLLGDGKYGRNSYNRSFTDRAGGKLTRQQLCATQLAFLQIEEGPLAYLAGRTFTIEPDFDWPLPAGSDEAQ
jgi:23S rRNA pseudouridine955/2504/2580 synthase